MHRFLFLYFFFYFFCFHIMTTENPLPKKYIMHFLAVTKNLIKSKKKLDPTS